MENLVKVCTKCEVRKGLVDFYKNKTCKGGFATYCKNCSNKNLRIWQKNNPDKVNTYSKNYCKKNLETVKRKHKVYKKNHIEEIKEYQLNYRINNIEERKETSAKWYQSNTEKAKESEIKYREANSEKISKRVAKRIEEMPDGYIKAALKQQNYPKELINNPEFIEIKRLIIQTKRLCKK